MSERLKAREGGGSGAESHGFNKREIVAISGAHSVGSSKAHDPTGPMKVSHSYFLKSGLDDVEKNTFNNKY